MKELMQIKDLIIDLSNKINAPSFLLPTFGYNADFARPEVRVDNEGYHYVIIERGEEYEHLVTQDLEELLYAVFQDITNSMASDYEAKHRIEYQDSRRIDFEKQIELLSMIDIEFAIKREKEIKAILDVHPFDDLAYGIPRLYFKISRIIEQFFQCVKRRLVMCPGTEICNQCKEVEKMMNGPHHGDYIGILFKLSHLVKKDILELYAGDCPIEDVREHLEKEDRYTINHYFRCKTCGKYFFIGFCCRGGYIFREETNVENIDS